jgi:segregation and condensation protein A
MTISQHEAATLPLGMPPTVSREAAEQVLTYLVFHRSLHDSPDGQGALLERYMALVRDLKEGVHVVIADPFHKALALLFELVLDEAFDPWEIDLVRFTELYLKRIHDEGGVDFAVAGRLVFMAWSILWLQSREILAHREPPPDPSTVGDGDPLGPFADDGFVGDLETPEAVDVTSAILESPQAPPLEMMVRHNETRPVSLLELVRAFGEAEQEARRSLRIEELRERLREEQRAPPEILVHGEIPERDVNEIWTAAMAHPIGEAFPFLDLWRVEQGRDRLVAFFLAALHLGGIRAVELRQEKIAESPLLIARASEALPAPRSEQ